jgi:hypothetical protein
VDQSGSCSAGALAGQTESSVVDAEVALLTSRPVPEEFFNIFSVAYRRWRPHSTRRPTQDQAARAQPNRGGVFHPQVP